MYEKIGYSQVELAYKTDIDKQTNKVKITFNAAQGQRIRIKDIFVEGNNSFPANKIIRLMKTRRAWLFNAGALKEDVLKEDMERIKSFYRKNGFADVAADYEVKSGSRKEFLFITVKIQEGKKYLVGSITVTGNKDIATKDILASIKETTPDKIFSQEAVKQDLANIQGVYFDRGYIQAQVEEATSVDPATNRVNIVYTITENEITYVNKIKIKGNIKTKDVVIRRELRIKPGDRFDGEKLRRSRERLQNLGYFDETNGISFDTEDTNSSDKKDLVVDVKETKTGSFSFGGGYSTVDQFVGFAEIEQKNFDWKNFPYFTGAGQDLKFRASIGSLTNNFDLSFTDPWIFDYPVSFGFDGYRRTHKRDTDVGYGYDEKVSGGDLRLGKELSEYVRGDIAYRYEVIDISNITDSASRDLFNEQGSKGVSSLEFGLSFDNRDNIFDTKKGNLLSSSWSVAGGPLGGAKDYWKFFGRASHYFPLILSSVLEVRARVGVAGAYDNTAKVPIYDRFFAGGADTIRGYHERSIGPVDPNSKDPLGGNGLLVANIEYTYPLFSFLKAAAFYDVGNVWSRLSDIGSSKNTNDPLSTGSFKSGVGFGFRIKTPLGPISLDYGIPLNKEPGKDSVGSGRFHFSVSNRF